MRGLVGLLATILVHLCWMTPGSANAQAQLTGPACFGPPNLDPYRGELLTHFPCDLNGTEQLPEIFLFGEIHSYAKNDPSSASFNQAFEEIGEVENRVHLLGRQQQLYLMKENPYTLLAGSSPTIENYRSLARQSYVLPIDDSLSFLLATMAGLPLIDHYLLQAHSEPKARAYAEHFLKQQLLGFWSSHYLQKTWKALHPNLRPRSQDLIDRLNQLACVVDGGSYVENWSHTWSEKDMHAILEVLRPLWVQFTRDLETIKAAPIIKPAGIERLQQAALKLAKTHSDREWLTLSLRIYDESQAARGVMMTMNLAKAYCALKTNGRPLIVQVGNLHVSTIQMLLERLFKRAGVEPAPIKALYSR